MNREKRLDKKADDILCMDAPTTQWGKWSVTTLGGLDRVASGMVVRGALVPFLRTPVRPFVRGLVHYTAWGRLDKENKAILEARSEEQSYELQSLKRSSSDATCCTNNTKALTISQPPTI